MTLRDTDDASYFVPTQPAISMEKLVSVDNRVTWHDADAAPGPETMAGYDIYFRFVIVNVGNVPLHAAADADDMTDMDDEDGVAVLPIITTASGGVNLMMTAVNATGETATLACWRDYLRCRIANAAADVASPTGPASSGEVEDYWITIVNVGACRPSGTFSVAAANLDPCPEVTISGLTWVDTKPDGVYSDEAVLSDVVLSVKNSKGERITIVTTGPDQFQPGRYLAQNLPPDKYLVALESWPTGYKPVEPTVRKVVLLNSGESTSADFAFTRQGSKVYIPLLLKSLP